MSDSNLVLWCLLDSRAGNQSQCLGVASFLDAPVTRKQLEFSFFSKLPNGLIGTSLAGLTLKSREAIERPWPHLLIAAGRRTAPVAAAIKKLSNNKTKIIQIMDPGRIRKYFDLVAVPSHDKLKRGGNIFSILGAPNPITNQSLFDSARKWTPCFSHFPRPWVGLLVGGSTRRRKFTRQMATQLGNMLSQALLKSGGSVLGTLSPRSGSIVKELSNALKVPHKIHQFDGGKDNPYLGILGLSDYLVVTGDSVSMCSEACAVGKPVYIFDPKNLITDKHKLFHNTLFRCGYARPFGGEFEEWSAPPLNTAQVVADEIKKRFF